MNEEEKNFDDLTAVLSSSDDSANEDEEIDYDIFSENELTLFEKDFCVCYVSNGGNAYQAAIASGWKETTAKSKSYKLVEKVGIRKYIAELNQKKAEKIFDSAVMSEQELLKMWSDIARGTMRNPNALPQEHYDNQLSFIEGNEINENAIPNISIPLSQRLKASEYIAKYKAMFKENETTVNITNDYSKLSDEELKKIIESKLKKE